jgi:hypothetical protein
MLYRGIIAVCSQIHTKHINTQSVPRSKHSISEIKTSQLMLYREIIAVCSQIHTKHMKTQSVPRSKHTASRRWNLLFNAVRFFMLNLMVHLLTTVFFRVSACSFSYLQI